MTTKTYGPGRPSPTQVAQAKARKRRTLREELHARCGVFNETDHGTSENAPEGWVEIQRNNSIDVEGVEPFDNDEHAALAVAELGGARGCAMHYECNSGMFEPVSLDGCGTTFERNQSINRAAGEITLGAARSWICIVPRSVAIAAGLLE